MVCIYCGSKTQVTNSRHQKATNSVWRRRKCVDCDAHWTTVEKINAETTHKVISGHHKKHIEPLERDILLFSVHDALRHRKTAVKDASALTDTVISKVLASKSADITKNELTAITYETLSCFDKLAADIYKANR